MPLSVATFEELSAVVQRLCGLVLGQDKAYLIEHRLEPLLRAYNLRNFDELAQMLRQPEGSRLHDSLIEQITTAETAFFRDSHPFQTLRRELFPTLVSAARAQGRRVKLWSAAASTGQEAYSLAILIAEYVRDNPGTGETDFSILATDISPRVLALAQQGEYTEREIARGLSAAQVARHFERRGDVWRVRESLRRLVEFRRLNLTQPLDNLGLFDVILCRNVLIYFDEAMKRKIVRQLRAQLYPTGWLMLGSAENLYTLDAGFESIHFGETLLYRVRGFDEAGP